MKRIVIKLSERAYEFVQKNGLKDVFGIDDAICNGVVLPKGCGRLIDADALKKEAVMYPTVGGAEVPLLDIMDVDSSPTIIEADTEETTNETTD